MLHLRLHKINPLVRAVGTMGAVAALVTGVTFAATGQTAAVTLTGTSLTSTTPGLAITSSSTGNPTDCSTTTATTSNGWVVTGSNGKPDLAPGDTSMPYYFCLDNTGDVPLGISMNSLNVAGAPAPDVTLNVSCVDSGNGTTTNVSGNLVSLETNQVVLDSNLANGAYDQCTVTASLSSAYTSSGDTLTFDLNFTGTSLS